MKIILKLITLIDNPNKINIELRYIDKEVKKWKAIDIKKRRINPNKPISPKLWLLEPKNSLLKIIP